MDKTITFTVDCNINVDLLDLIKKSDNKIYDLSNPDWLKIGSYIDKKYFVCKDTARLKKKFEYINSICNQNNSPFLLILCHE